MSTEPPSPPEVDDPSAAPAEPPAPRRTFSVWFVLAPLLLVVAAAIIAASVIRAPYVMFAPGSARSTEPLISVPADKSHKTNGEVLFTTVTVINPTYAGAIWGWLKHDIDVYPRKLIYGDQTDAQSRSEGKADMNQSKLLAAKVALEQLGYPVEVHGTGVLLQTVDGSLPAAKVLKAGDVVVAADGRPTLVDSALVKGIKAHEAGETIQLTIERKGEKGRRTVTATLARREGTERSPVLGVQLQTRDLRFTLPFDVGIDSGDVGGPSAGLAFTLGVLDRMTPGSITGGHKVAVTGVITADGQVQDVGGVQQKAVAARQAGAEVFIVPTDEYADARKTAGSMRVVKVDTLADALQVLAQLGGNALDLGKPGAGT